MATPTSKQLVQYGAVTAGAVAIPALVKGASAASAAYSNYLAPGNIDTYTGTAAEIYTDAAKTAVDAGTKAFSQSFMDIVASPAFLTSVGLGLAGMVLGSGSKRPSLSLPNLAATAAVGISVSSLLAQGKAAAAAATGSKGTGAVAPIAFKTAPVEDVGTMTATSRQKGVASVYKFPLNANANYWMKLSIKEYQRNNIGQDASANPSYNTIIKLPLPVQLMDAMKIAYSDVSLGMFGGPFAEGMSNVLESIEAAKGTGLAGQTRAGMEQTKTQLKTLMGNKEFAYALGRRALQSVGTLGQTADLITGSAPNPYMAVSFSGVNLKRHSFTWRLSPSTIEESKQLQYIVRELQRAALPEYETDQKFMFKFPDVVQVELSPTNLMVFKPCAIDAVIVNYAPNGVPSFFKNPQSASGDSFERYPTEIEFTISLRELDVHDKKMPFYAVNNDAPTASGATEGDQKVDTQEVVKPPVSVNNPAQA